MAPRSLSKRATEDTEVDLPAGDIGDTNADAAGAEDLPSGDNVVESLEDETTAAIEKTIA